MDLLYTDNRIVVCLKPAGVLSTDEPGGMPELLRRALGESETGCVRVVHRLDRDGLRPLTHGGQSAVQAGAGAYI